MSEDENRDMIIKFYDDPKYTQRIAEMVTAKNQSFEIDYDELCQLGLGDDIIDRPEDIFEMLKETLVFYIEHNHPEVEDRQIFTIRIANIFPKIPLREVSSKYVGKLIAVRGIVTHVSKIEPMLIEGAFICSKCGVPNLKPQTGDFLDTPAKCESCGKMKGVDWTLSPENSVWTDAQFIRIQECPEDVPSGSIPSFLDCRIKNKDLLNKIRAGDRVNAIGILMVNVPYKYSNKPRIFSVRLDINNIISDTKDYSTIEISKTDEEKIKALASQPEIIQFLTNSIVPSIYGYSYIKESILYLLFGGVTKFYPDLRVRGEIHILLIGDPSMAKSQLLKGVASIAPRGIYTSGKGASAAGLTAAVVKTKDGAEEHLALEAGTLVLADRGVACIDEFDKMDDKDRSAIHEALEQQTVSISKAGINATLPSRTAVLAAANPVGGRYNKDISFMENINFPVTLLSRFDIIYVVKDFIDEEKDEEIAEHVLNTHDFKMHQELDSALLKKYIAYARRFNPELSREAIDHMKKFYVEMRKKSKGKTISIASRQLEALQRISEARARIRLKPVVDLEDVDGAIKILCQSLESLGIDLEHPDIDNRELGECRTKSDKLSTVYGIIRGLEFGKTIVKIEEIMEEAEKHGITEKEVEDILLKLSSDRKICFPDGKNPHSV